jgi:DNA repair exonuclease SbcCD ATPase subunit
MFGAALLTVALLPVAVFSANCGGSARRASAAPVARRPEAPELLLQEARQAEEQGRLAEALVLYDSVASGRQVDKSTRTEALAHGATLRLSADPARRDLTTAQTMLAEVTRLDPRFTTPVPVTTLAAVLQDVQALRTRANELDTALRTRERQTTRVSTSQQQLDQKAAALRNENRQLREEIKALQAELARKEEALRRTAEKLLNTPPNPY